MLNTATTTSSTVVSPTASLSAAPHTGPSVKDAAVLSPKRKRRPAGTPDPDAEVVALSPRTLLESDRYVCDICGQGFQRDQNLQMHRRRHKVPWKLLKKDQSSQVTDAAAAEGATRKRVFVCPEPTCLHNDARHALGDLVGIKKHFRRKHSHHKQWVCEKCSKAYAVQSDYKAHLKTCGTRGHSCDCGRVFSRVESFIEHQDSCTAGSARVQPLPELQPLRVTLACPPGTMASSASQYSTDPNFSVIASRPSPLPPMHGFTLIPKSAPEKLFFSSQYQAMDLHHNLELQLQVPSSSNISTDTCFPLPLPPQPLDVHRDLALAIGSAAAAEEQRPSGAEAAANLAAADEARRATRRQIEMAEVEFANAKRIRQQAKAELESAELLREEATRKLNSTVMQITCHACKRHFQAASNSAVEDESTSLATSYVSSATTEGDGDQ